MIVRITSKFKEIDSAHSIPHTGIDLAFPENTPLNSFTNGIVDKVFNGNTSIGNGLSISLPDGNRVIYGHMNQVNVKVGEQVSNGDFLGLSGNTGNSTGAHLHLGLKDAHGHLLDPSPLVSKVMDHAGNENIVLRAWHSTTELFSHLGEWIGGKITEATVNNIMDWITAITPALPIITVISFSVYALINMFSKRGAKLGAIGTFIYGLLVIESG